MLDKKFLRANREIYEASLKRRGLNSNYEEFVKLDQTANKIITEEEEIRSTQKKIKEFNDEARTLKEKLGILNQKREKSETELRDWLLNQPNLLHPDVPAGKDETENVEVFSFGHRNLKGIPHYDFFDQLIMKEEAAKLSGARFVIFKSALAKLHRALSTWMLQKNKELGYEEYIVPYLVNEEAFYGTGQLPKFAQDAFQTTDGKWLISTAEVSLVNIFRDKIFEEEELPKLCMAYSPCFRSEAGAAGRDTRGMIRLHQFHKVELVTLCRAEDASFFHEKKRNAAENLLQDLKLPYRIILLCGGDAGFSAYKQYDIEIWMPGLQRYLEIASCSQCETFQARRANIRYRTSEGLKFVHTLNGSSLPIERTISAILENYLNADGSITIPEVLQDFCEGKIISKEGLIS